MHNLFFKALFNKLALAVLFVLCNCCVFAQSVPLPNAFSHNDYAHKRPLRDALANGYTNIEADVFLFDNNLVVAHVNPYFKSHRKLENLYLKPLLQQIIDNGGHVYKNYDHPITLLIDIKSEANITYEALKSLLEKYRDILTSYDNGVVKEGAVTIVLSGHKPYSMLEAENNRLAFIDKDLRQPTRDTSVTNVYTMASCKYSKLIKWNGYGMFPERQREKLVTYVTQAHEHGEKVRLWASPENKVVWGELLKCGVDLINTNKLVALKQFLINTEHPAELKDPLKAVSLNF
ncbi:MAG: phosphatidylinositol-specific phospholipase C/glycerophosphodiester phosphodiesterase family protein [Mucilaginibacter sp.]